MISLFDPDSAPSDPATGQPAGVTLPAPAGWPAPPSQEAFHGLAGQLVAKIAPNTEADPVAILTQLLVCCGTLIGRGAHFRVEATLHHPNQFLLLIGDSSLGPDMLRATYPGLCCLQKYVALTLGAAACGGDRVRSRNIFRGVRGSRGTRAGGRVGGSVRA